MSNVVTVTIGASLFALLICGCSASGSASQALGGASSYSGTGGSNTAAGAGSIGGGEQGTGGTTETVQSTGCTPGQVTTSGTLTGAFGGHLVTAGDKQYYIQVNEWGATAAQTMSYGGGSFFQITQQQASLSVSGAPAGYPSVFIGANSNHATTGSGLPIQVSSISQVLTTWNWSDNGAASDTTNNSFNATYDVWFSVNPGGDPAAGAPTGGYLMVWYYAQGCQPIGALVDAGRTIGGIPGYWDVWTGTNNGKPVISYKHQGMLQSFGFDLNVFIQDALTNYPANMQSGWYFEQCFFGIRDLERWRQFAVNQLLCRG